MKPGICAVGSASTLTAAVTASGITFSYGAGGSSHVPFSAGDVPTLAGDVSAALAKLVGTSSTGSNLSSATYDGVNYPYVDMSFNYGYEKIGNTSVKGYLKSAGLTDAQISTLAKADCLVVLSGTASAPTGVRGYYYLDPDNASNYIVVSASGTRQTVPKSTSIQIGYYASLM